MLISQFNARGTYIHNYNIFTELSEIKLYEQ